MTRAVQIACLVLCLVAAPAVAAHNGPPPPSFYSVGDVARGAPGTIVRTWRLRSPSSVVVRVVLFHSRDAKGHDVIESGVVALPAGRAPKAGFPIVSFGHGTTGFTDAAAPSRTGDTGSAYTIADLINRFVGRRWALALADYEGLGTPGTLAYDVGSSAAHSILDVARAARHLGHGSVSRRLGVIGHSEGGHAALWAGQVAHRYAPDLRLRAVVASSPGADLKAIGVEREHSAFTTLGVLGVIGDWHAFYGAPVGDLLTEDGVRAADQVLADHADQADLSRPVFAPGFSTEVEPWSTLLRRNTPGAAAIPAPTLILVGTEDQQIPPDTTIAFARRLQKRGDDVRLRVIDGADHDGALSTTTSTWMALLRARLSG